MLEVIELYFLLFISYAFLGWCMEVICKLIQYKRFINRGFLIGPYCPIYGWGALLITILLQKYNNDPLTLFILAMVICSILEYVTSYFMEKIFKARWWDYSTKKFNLNGRICLNTMIPFGLLGLLMIYVINPFLFNLYGSFNREVLYTITIIIATIFIIDNIVSLVILTSVREDNKLLEKDNTEEMSKKVIERIKSHNILSRRLLAAFPDFKHIGVVIKEKTKKTKDIINKHISKQEKVMKDTEEQIKKIEKKYNSKLAKVREKSNKKIIKLSEKDYGNKQK